MALPLGKYVCSSKASFCRAGAFTTASSSVMYPFAYGPLGWAGRIAPEKGLEDAARAAAVLGESLLVWGLREDPAYAAAVEAMVPAGTIQWRGFQPTHALQQQLGSCHPSSGRGPGSAMAPDPGGRRRPQRGGVGQRVH
mgnify:CR=1 FL=1